MYKRQRDYQPKIEKITTTAGLEPARAEPKRFLIFRLNHSAKLPMIITNFCKLIMLNII